MTASLFKHTFYCFLERTYFFKRNKCLDCSGKTTTVNTAGPFSIQRFFCDSQRNGHILMGHSCSRRNIL